MKETLKAQVQESLFILSTRIKRLGRLAMRLAFFILIMAWLVFGSMSKWFEIAHAISNPAINEVAGIATVVTRYGISIIILIIYMFLAFSGQWDLNYKLICRHRVKENEYKEPIIYTEKIKNVQIYENHKLKEIKIFDLRNVSDFEKQSCLFVKINNHYIMIRDIKILDNDSDTLKIYAYPYKGNNLIYSKNLFGYEYEIIKNSNETAEKELLPTEIDKYFKHSMRMHETHIKDSFKEDLSEGFAFAKKVAVCLAIVIFGTFITRYTALSIEKYSIEKRATIVKSVENTPIVLDMATDTYLIPEIEKNLKQINPIILDDFVTSGWKIRITNESMESHGIYFGYRNEGPIIGATSTIYKYIIIPNNEEDINASVIHEMGHFIDDWKYSKTDEWDRIYFEEKDTYLRDYAKTNKFEGFACEYMDFVQRPLELVIKSPKTYGYIKKVLYEKYQIKA